MPLSFAARTGAQAHLRYDAAHAQELLIDLNSNRIVATIVYGTFDRGKFTRNRNIPANRRVLEGLAFARIAAKLPNATKSLYENIKETLWQELIAAGVEQGTIV